MKILLLSISCLFASICSPAQNASLTVYFDSNVFTLSKAQRLRIDSFIASLPNIPQAYTARVSGHTDSRGSLQLNMPLSKRRAQSVAGYLQSHYLRTTDSTLGYFAYNRPAVENTEGNLWKNRRVEIEVQLRKLDMPAILGVKDFGPRKFKLIEDIGGTLIYDSTKIVIAANSFKHSDGSEVTGEIEISYQEYRTPADFILGEIPMSLKSDNELKHFNSGGMFGIFAFQNGEELVLKPAQDKQIVVNLPLTDVTDQGSYVFDRSTNAWNNQQQPITNAHGSMLPPFGRPGLNFSSDNFMTCLQPRRDTCAYINGLVDKLKYFTAHEEPLNPDYAYKFIKNNVVDFKSSWYRLLVDTVAAQVRFVPANSHSKLGKFADYTWTFEPSEFAKFRRDNFKYGCAFVKLAYKGQNRFYVEMGQQVYYATGRPADFSGSDKKLKRLHKKNFRSYLKYTHGLDSDEKTYEKALKQELNVRELKNIYSDSLACLNYFYRYAVKPAGDQEFPDLYNYNIHKDVLSKTLKLFTDTFSCVKFKKLMIARDSAMYNKKAAFAKFGISTTGIFNADAVKQINDPETIDASYVSDKGKPLNIVAIFIGMKGLNGIIRYDGFMGYSPQHFVYGKSDINVMLAISDRDESYVCYPEDFSKAVSSAANGKVLFTVAALSPLGTTANLQKIVKK